MQMKVEYSYRLSIYKDLNEVKNMYIYKLDFLVDIIMHLYHSIQETFL